MTDIGRPHSGHLPVLDAPGHPGRLKASVAARVDRLRQNSLWRARVRGPQTPGLVSTTTVVAGVLLTLTPFLWSGPGNSSGWTAAVWNAAITGIAITSLGLVRLTKPLRLAVATGLGCLFGGWLLVAPLFLDYGFGSQSILVTNVDMLVGVAVLLITIFGHVHARSSAEMSESSQQQGR